MENNQSVVVDIEHKNGTGNGSDNSKFEHIQAPKGVLYKLLFSGLFVFCVGSIVIFGNNHKITTESSMNKLSHSRSMLSWGASRKTTTSDVHSSVMSDTTSFADDTAEQPASQLPPPPLKPFCTDDNGGRASFMTYDRYQDVTSRYPVVYRAISAQFHDVKKGLLPDGQHLDRNGYTCTPWEFARVAIEPLDAIQARKHSLDESSQGGLTLLMKINVAAYNQWRQTNPAWPELCVYKIDGTNNFHIAPKQRQSLNIGAVRRDVRSDFMQMMDIYISSGDAAGATGDGARRDVAGRDVATNMAIGWQIPRYQVDIIDIPDDLIRALTTEMLPRGNPQHQIVAVLRMANERYSRQVTWKDEQFMQNM